MGRIVEVWRYPVRSLGGEQLSAASLTASGIVGDRRFVLVDAATGTPATPEKDQRWRKALHLRAETHSNAIPSVIFPCGQSHTVTDPAIAAALSEYFDFAVTIAACDESSAQHGLPLVSGHERHAALHLVTSASLGRLAELRQAPSVDRRRFRPNLLVDTPGSTQFLEQGWIGRTMRVGAAALLAFEDTRRCAVTLLPQPGLDEDPEILRSITRHNRRSFGVYCAVEIEGTVRLGDACFM